MGLQDFRKFIFCGYGSPPAIFALMCLRSCTEVYVSCACVLEALASGSMLWIEKN